MTLPPNIPQPPEHDAWSTPGPTIEPAPYVDWATFKAWSDQWYVVVRSLELRCDGIDGRINAIDQRVRALENPP